MAIHSIYFLQGMYVRVEEISASSRWIKKFILTLSKTEVMENPIIGIANVNSKKEISIDFEKHYFGLLNHTICSQLAPFILNFKHSTCSLVYFTQEIYFTLGQHSVE